MQWIHAYYVYIDSKLNNFVKEYMFNNTLILILKANNYILIIEQKTLRRLDGPEIIHQIFL